MQAIEDGKRASAAGKKETSEFRDYRAEARPSVKELYRLNHENQTLSFVLEKERRYLSLHRQRAGMWEVLERLERLVDDSDPDTEQSQIAHALQSAEAARRDGQPPWFVLTALIHDAGKVLCLWGEPQWAVVGDTFPLGCAFSDRIVFPELFANNPDLQNPRSQTPCGIYEEGCGLAEVHMSWGHDEYLYHVVKDYLPMEAQYMIRYHSFYAAHREGAYGHLMNEQDRRMMEWVRRFNPYDLYSKADAPPDVARLRPYYQDLLATYFPDELRW
ncbi:inositol oxygenase family protein [Polyangium fumosum]|uniref:Inositol oxygenase n=1 Tax=Polyangium fumosum TaxID=889272 RepID=A0A4U1J1S0_9BACT|nr:inositol oxygenase family protein [Polyangium fumosum]TKD00897.1 inositol oxygenase [Polyangium fumosum]